MQHNSPLVEAVCEDNNIDRQDITCSESTEVNLMFGHLDERSHSDFISNVLFYIGGFVVSKLVKKLNCRACRDSLVADISPAKKSDHDYCGASSRYSEVSSAFTLFVNNGGLRIPSKSVFTIIEYCKHIFKAYVCKEDGKSISNQNNLKSKMILEVCHHFLMDSNQPVFADHELGTNESLVEDDHQMKLIKCTYSREILHTTPVYLCAIVQNGMPSDRHQLTKLILFKNQ